ncbi:GspH/FimT family pseudopilin [Marinobacter sp. CHS3-4]|uniref:GspH/FimT family pseudopilin n=1 Tax=Marinobacter sp. CHS3-4 TaxID=3045174 RepID=UPI0024B54EF2|nr:GspH/FimT family pseudopilin [Marinobacter sp. CHS3-4]MDI9246788.1 GspH/FimT family pseudopilin [Marinobacter sp. CHS3-4]
MPRFYKVRGFTLIEALITLTIFALITGFVSSSLAPLVAANRHSESVNEAMRMFSIARSYAIHRNSLTTLCPLSPASQKCTDDWSLPVSVFPDSNNDKRPDSGKIYQLFTPATEQSTIFSRTAGRGYFQLGADGMSRGSMGSLVVCTPAETGKRHTKMTYIALNIGGRVRALADKDKDGRLTLPWGTVISCPPT